MDTVAKPVTRDSLTILESLELWKDKKQKLGHHYRYLITERYAPLDGSSKNFTLIEVDHSEIISRKHLSYT